MKLNSRKINTIRDSSKCKHLRTSFPRSKLVKGIQTSLSTTCFSAGLPVTAGRKIDRCENWRPFWDDDDDEWNKFELIESTWLGRAPAKGPKKMHKFNDPVPRPKFAFCSWKSAPPGRKTIEKFIIFRGGWRTCSGMINWNSSTSFAVPSWDTRHRQRMLILGAMGWNSWSIFLIS